VSIGAASAPWPVVRRRCTREGGGRDAAVADVVLLASVVPIAFESDVKDHPHIEVLASPIAGIAWLAPPP
jgi:hypothetical protein